jgi:PAS domain S-box-containing protein
MLGLLKSCARDEPRGACFNPNDRVALGFWPIDLTRPEAAATGAVECVPDIRDITRKYDQLSLSDQLTPSDEFKSASNLNGDEVPNASADRTRGLSFVEEIKAESRAIVQPASKRKSPDEYLEVESRSQGVFTQRVPSFTISDDGQPTQQKRMRRSKSVSTLPSIFCDLPTQLSDAWSHSNQAKDAVVIMETVRPFRIVHVNKPWETLCGFQSSEVVGGTMKCIQGPHSCPTMLGQLLEDLQQARPSCRQMTSHDKRGNPFEHYLRISPLRDDTGQVSHFYGVLVPCM